MLDRTPNAASITSSEEAEHQLKTNRTTPNNKTNAKHQSRGKENLKTTMLARTQKDQSSMVSINGWKLKNWVPPQYLYVKP